ncbi:MAG TPA: hypothetical protein P5526_23590 [Anaerolineae bacterium]|nr:hypothetical protein [Anaerolineae bacterium]
MADYLMDTNHLSPLVTLRHPLRHRFLKANKVDILLPWLFRP